jgi:hypothetical protein
MKDRSEPGLKIGDVALSIARRLEAQARERKRRAWETIQAEEPALARLLLDLRSRFPESRLVSCHLNKQRVWPARKRPGDKPG